MFDVAVYVYIITRILSWLEAALVCDDRSRSERTVVSKQKESSRLDSDRKYFWHMVALVGGRVV